MASICGRSTVVRIGLNRGLLLTATQRMTLYANSQSAPTRASRRHWQLSTQGTRIHFMPPFTLGCIPWWEERITYTNTLPHRECTFLRTAGITGHFSPLLSE